MLIRDVMTPAPLTVSSGTSVHDAAGLLSRYGFALLPVLAGGALVGVVTVSDVLRARDAGPGSPARVGEVMTRTAYVVHPDTDIAEVAVLMVDRGLRSLPVVADGELVGIVTRLDVTRVLARSDADLCAAVERKLDAYAGWSRWTVHVEGGRGRALRRFRRSGGAAPRHGHRRRRPRHRARRHPPPGRLSARAPGGR